MNNSGYRLYCDKRLLSKRLCVQDLTFEQAVSQIGDINFRRIISGWIEKSGPFIGDKDKIAKEKYLEDEFKNFVSRNSIGLAAWQTSIGNIIHTFSFDPSRYNKSPLSITWYKNNNETEKLSINNFWKLQSLKEFLNNHTEAPKSWKTFIEQCKDKYTNLNFSDEIIMILEPHPFIESIANRIMELLKILSDISNSFDENNKLNSHGNELIKIYFHGDKALFSDESDTNKRVFKKELTFIYKKNNEKKSIFCPYHGKVKQLQYRIHFSWPKEKYEPIYIAYIGPKITKN